MQILSTNDNISTVRPKIFETPDTLIINAHIYDKASLKPIPFEFYNTQTAYTYSNLAYCIHTLDNADYSYTTGVANPKFMSTYFLHDGNNHQKLFQDITHSDIFYQIVRINTNPGTIRFLKYQKNGNNIKLITTTEYNSGNRWYDGSSSSDCYYQSGHDIYVLYQNETYIVFVHKYPYAGSNSTMTTNLYTQNRGSRFDLIKYNKDTGGVAAIISHNDYLYNYQFLEAKDDDIYILRHVRHFNSGSAYNKYVKPTSNTSTVNNWYIVKINIISGTETVLFTKSDTGDTFMVDNIIKVNDFYYTFKANGKKYEFSKLKLDTVNDTVTEEVININYNSFEEFNSSAYNFEGDLIYHTLKSISVNNKDFIICTIHCIPNHKFYPECHKNIVFEIVKTTKIVETIETNEETGEEVIVKQEITEEEAVVTDVIPFLNGCKGVLEYIDPNVLIFLFFDGIEFCKFDSTQGKYIECYKKGGIFNVIGLDTLNRFYAQYSNGDVEVMTALNACTLKADFAEEYYQSINIDTEIYYYAKNFIDEYLSTDVVISLIGPVQFKDDSSKEKIIRTSGEGIDTLPVTITGSGRIEVVIAQYTD